MSDGTKEGLLRLAGLVTDRRWKQLGLRQDQLAHGPSTTTMTQVEAGEPVSGLSYRKLEHSLGWQPGSCNAVLAGGDPVIEVEKPPYRIDPHRDLVRPRRSNPTGDPQRVKLPDLTPIDLLLLAMDTAPDDRTEAQWDLLHVAADRVSQLERRIAVVEELLLKRQAADDVRSSDEGESASLVDRATAASIAELQIDGGVDDTKQAR